MTPSIGCACNFYNEGNALHPFLENVTRFFDDVLLIHTPPEGRVDDESVDIAKKWGVKLLFDNIEKGYGKIRTDLIHKSTTEWVMIMDADERFYPELPLLSCQGEEAYPEHPYPNLSVSVVAACYSQAELLKSMMQYADGGLAIRTCRRHWMDTTMRHPCQNWLIRPDWQLRIIKNDKNVGYDPKIRMHEQLLDFRTGKTPKHVTASVEKSLYHDHFQITYKGMEQEQLEEDRRIYESLQSGSSARGKT